MKTFNHLQVSYVKPIVGDCSRSTDNGLDEARSKINRQFPVAAIVCTAPQALWAATALYY
jgi:hypothetical protein